MTQPDRESLEIHVEPVDPGPIRLRSRDSGSDPAFALGCVILVGAVLVGIAIGLLVSLLLLQPAPRSAAEPSSSSVRPSSGAPSTQAVSPDSAMPAVGPTSGGTPPSPAAAQQPTTLVVSEPASIGTVLEAGGINQAGRSHGPSYLAIRSPRGTVVRICGPAACRVMTSTDYGPQHGTGKIADVALVVWREICGLPDSAGVCRGTIEYPWGGGVSPTLPPTDTSDD